MSTTTATGLREPGKIAYWIVVGIVAAAAATGLRPLFIQEMGWVFGTLMAIAVALAIEVLFSQSLRELRGSGSILHLVLAVLFGLMSMVCDTPYLFRMVNGAQLTMREFSEQRDTAVRDVVVARERLAAAADAAHDLAKVSQQKAAREAASGDSCEKSTQGRGVRYDFRIADSEDFQQVEHAIATRSQRLEVTVAQIQAVPSETGEALREGLGKLNASLAAAYGIVHDPALTGLADRLDARAQSDDTVRHGRNGEAFRCPDAMIRDRARATAAQLRLLPDLQQRAVVADFTDANTVLVALPVRIAATLGHGIGTPGSLSGSDLIALAISLALELLLVGATFHTPTDRSIGNRLTTAQRAMGSTPGGDIGAFLNLLGDADPKLARLWSLINRYRVRLWLWEIVVVAHGVDDPRLVQFSRVMSILSAIGWARRYRTLPMPFVRVICWFRWPEMRKALHLEYFRLDLRAMDELNLGELLSSMRAEPDLADAAGWQSELGARLNALTVAAE
jgi:hypothetical protein